MHRRSQKRPRYDSSIGRYDYNLHPTGKVGPAGVESTMHMLVAVHSLALASMPVLFLGAWGMSRRLASADRLAMAALVLYAFATVAVMNAAVFDGLVAPNLMRQIVTVAPAASDTQSAGERTAPHNRCGPKHDGYQVRHSVQLRKGLIQLEVLVERGLPASGHLNPDVHGIGLVIFGQALWFIISGVLLCRVREV